jgi:hypothetical protein
LSPPKQSSAPTRERTVVEDDVPARDTSDPSPGTPDAGTGAVGDTSTHADSGTDADAETDSGTGTDAGTDADSDADPDADPGAGGADVPGSGRRRWIRRPELRPEVRSALWWVTTGLAVALVFAALVMPNKLWRLTPGNFVAIPLEGLVAVALVLLLPGRLRRVFAGLFGAAVGLLVIQKTFDMGYFAVLARPFDPVMDATLLGPGIDYLTTSMGRPAAIAVVAGAVVLGVAVIALLTVSMLRVARLTTRYRRQSIGGLALATLTWVLCAVLGAQYVPGKPVATYDATDLVRDRAAQVREDLQDRKDFLELAGQDEFGDIPGDQLLTGLRGKDVVLAFVESYGRSAIEDPSMAAAVGATLADGDRRLRAAGYSARSGWLTSSTVGGGSWLAHATLLSGLWVDNEQRYRTLVNSERMTLNSAFKRAGWRSVGVMPEIRRAWPEGDFYDYDAMYGLDQLGYEGPKFGYATMPDQFTMSALQRLERAKPDRAPLMAEVALVTSHAPWSPLPRHVDWNAVGDGSVFDSMVGPGDKKRAVWRDQAKARAAYVTSIRYAVDNLVSYVETYGDDNLVLVFLGDHQPAPMITGQDADHDVPVTIVARDPKVMEQTARWFWTDGLKPAPEAPKWRMNEFRDRFLKAFSPALTAPAATKPAATAPATASTPAATADR